MLRRITVGLKGGILRVASVAEVAARLLLLVGGAPGCGRASPALGDSEPCWRLLDHVGETDWLPAASQCATAGGPWHWCACGPPGSAGPGSGILPPSRPFSCRPGCACQCTVSRSCALVCASAVAVAVAASGRLYHFKSI
jgi:hypothetical protein